MPETKPAWDERTTLLRPPPPDPNKAPIENVLEVTELAILGPDIFTNAREPWHPPGARGIYGGSVIAQCLASAQKTVPADFLVHSCHCYFLLAGSGTTPILFHVERVRDGRSFATRTVQARQRGRCIFTTTISFTLEGSAGEGQVHHAAALPEGVALPPRDWDEEAEWEKHGPVQTLTVARGEEDDERVPLDRRRHMRWSRMRGTISEAGGHQAHLNALAYMSDSWFIGTVSRLHRLWRMPFAPSDVAELPDSVRAQVTSILAGDGFTEADGPAAWEERPRLGMMVSLDHSIYFHAPRRVRADEWMLSEMQSPWSGDGRGFVVQKIFAADGTLLASCMQEGVVRLDSKGREKGAKM
ncbi:acyl-CoA thioesterase II [Cordyceps fumosorosea ARSEF 2679]|uniref:Acyl-CoA thioesterase II n=1 Tax=Cordyceps fumosorosea (strain ARSEF 2679) TaxID=1081104 RepID=A0A162JE53_CORFA|nr:acyl-CoA thioesterase II [Cordyceps fumosorosea ARSEF 2679]OAA67622.1 acyl-CoA thioesterase II [Cordyceps fumosorosea ARSEF 2679]